MRKKSTKVAEGSPRRIRGEHLGNQSEKLLISVMVLPLSSKASQ